MQQRSIGDVEVSAIGLGAMPLSVDPAPDAAAGRGHRARGPRRRRDAHRHRGRVHAEHAGTCPGTTSRWSPGRCASYGGDTSDVLVATKGGHTRTPDGGWHTDGRPEHLRRACEASLKALGVDVIGLYQHHRPDPDVPYAETMGGLKALLDAGLVQRVGISNADPDQIRTAHGILGDGLVSVQNQLSPAFRSSRPEVELCEELGLAFLPWSPLGGAGRAAPWGGASAFADVAEARVSPQQVASRGCWGCRPGDPDPRREPARVGPQLGGGGRPRADRRHGQRWTPADPRTKPRRHWQRTHLQAW